MAFSSFAVLCIMDDVIASRGCETFFSHCMPSKETAATRYKYVKN